MPRPDDITTESVQVSNLQDGDTLVIDDLEYGPITIRQKQWGMTGNGIYLSTSDDYSGLVLVRDSYVVRKVRERPLKVGDHVYDAICRGIVAYGDECKPGTIVSINGEWAWVQWNAPHGAHATLKLSSLTRP